MFHGELWGWWAFNIASIERSGAAKNLRTRISEQESPQINFGYGGHQEARGVSH